MWPAIKQKLLPPVFENDEDKTRVANLVSVVLLTMFSIALVRTIFFAAVSPRHLSFILKQCGIMALVFAGVFILMHLGRVRLAAFVFTIYQWLDVAFITYRYGGVSLSIYSFFIFVILAAGLFLGGKWAVAYASLSVVYGTILLYLEHLGVIVARQSGPLEAYSIVTPSFITTAVIVYLYYRDITSALARAQGNAAELSQANLQLNNAIAERKQMEEQLLHSQKMEAIGTLAGGIAHDFNNILTIICGYGDLAKMQLGKDLATTENYLDEALKGAQRARELVKQILTFSRKAEHARQPLQLSSFIKEMIKFLRASIPTTVEIKMSINSQSIVMADPTQIHQVVMNLCTNAFQAMRDHVGILEIKLTDQTISRERDLGGTKIGPVPYICLEVNDTGCGMDEETQSKIFEPYFTTKEKGKGTGLGLAVVFGIVQAHHGFMEVDSRVDRGTSIMVFLPICTEETGRNPTADNDHRLTLGGGKERILFVDDEIAIAEYCRTLLKKYGYQVTSCTNVNQAFQEFSEHPDSYDLVITDMTMPEMTGLDLARKILAISPKMPIVICSGYSDRINRDNARSLGFSAYCGKPLNVDELLSTMRRVLEGARATL